MTPRSPRRARWLVVLLALASAAAGLGLLVTGGSPPEPSAAPAPRRAPVAADGVELTAPAAPASAAPTAEDAAELAREREPARVRGRVEDATGRPVPGARLRLVAVDLAAQRGVPAPDGALLAEAPSDPDGAFDLPAPSGPLARLTAEAPGLARAVALVDDAGARLTLTLLPEARLRVRARRADGTPVTEARAEVRAGRLLLEADLPAGEALLERLPPGTAQVRLRASGLAGEAGPVTLRAGAEAEALVVLDAVVVVAGSVRALEDDAPLVGAEVRVTRPGRSAPPLTTDGDGRFGPVEAGAAGESVWLAVQAPGRPAHLHPLLLPSAAGGPVEVEVQVPSAPALAGRVEEPDGAPAAGARVGYTSDGVAGHEAATTTAGEDGRFTLPPPPQPAPGRRIVLQAQGRGGRAALALRPGVRPAEPVVLRLLPGMAVRARVLDGAGAPRAGVLLRLQPAWDALPERSAADALHLLNATRAGGLSALSDETGRVLVRDVPAGTFRVALEAARGARVLPDLVEVPPADAASGRLLDLGRLALGGGLTLSGRVEDAEGTPVAGARVRELRTREDPRGALAHSDAEGRFLLSDLTPGRTTLEAQAEGLGRVAGEVTLPHDGPLVLRLPAAADLELRVEGPRGPWSGLLRPRLAAPRERGPGLALPAVLVEEGRALLRGLPPGAWRLEAEGPDGQRGRTVGDLVLEAGVRAQATLALEAPGRLAGRVLTPAGRPAAGARVTAVSVQDGARAGLALCDAAGAFALRLAPGLYTLRAEGRGGAPATQGAEVRGGAAESLDLRLLPAGALAVRVTRPGGGPVEGALVSLRPDEGSAGPSTGPLRTGADGRLLRTDLPAGGVLLRVRAPGGLAGAARAVVRADSTTEVEVEVSPAGPDASR